MRSRPKWHAQLTSLAVLYAVFAVLAAVAMVIRDASSRVEVAALVFLLSSLCLVFLRVSPLVRLGLGAIAIAAAGVASFGQPAIMLLGISPAVLFVVAFVVPTWLAAAILGLMLAVEMGLSGFAYGPRVMGVALILTEAAAFAMLSESRKRLQREHRTLSSASGELSHTLKQVEYLALHDALTGLPNRRLLTERLEEALSQSPADHPLVAVAFIDLDRFKAVNDGAGHGFGDRVLRAVATELGRELQRGDVLGRQGGDEFILVLTSTNSPVEAQERIEAMRTRLAAGITIQGQPVFATASFGVAFYPEDGHSSDELLRHADLALYRAKDEGRNRISLFNGELERQAARAFHLGSSLHRALDQSEFILEYQPQVDILTGRTLGMEALVRWRPNDEVLMPDAFLPDATQAGLMEEIDQWVLQRAMAEVADLRWWRQHAMTLAVNVSLVSLESPQFVPRLAGLLSATRITPDRLELEITESMMSRNTALIAERLAELRRLGISVAIDDFGVGYSSLSYLKLFPATRLKIDRAFVSGLEESDSIARAIIAVAKSLKLGLVAEGVETAAQAERLLAIGCDVAQGYYYSPATPLQDILLKYSPSPTEHPA